MAATTSSAPKGVFVHPAGLCESPTVGEGTRIWAFAHVLPGATVGRDCNICDGAFVESGAVVGNGVTIKNSVLVWDGVTVEDAVFLGPAMVFTNDLKPRAHRKKGPDELSPTFVRHGATIGANATIVCGITIGRHAFIAAGAVVIRDVVPHALMVGNPGKHIGWVCECGERLDEGLSCPDCGVRYESDPHTGGLRPLETS